MGAPIAVRSRVGRGTVFSIEVPVGKAPRSTEPAPVGMRVPIGLTLQGSFFVVVEDEAAVREGLVVLLQAWGARVVAFDGVETVKAWLAGGADRVGAERAEQPDLLLVDYRLPQALTGIDALIALRAHWPDQRLPAIMITGSTLGGHEDEASNHDYHLLIKPVLPNKLRAMIAFKLGLRAAGTRA
jgi:CheY-like chemotaxis protein